MCLVTYKPGFTNLSKFYWLRLFQITFYAMQRSNVFRVLIMCHLDLYLAIGSFWKWTPGKKLNTKNALLIERKTSPGASRHRTFLLSAWTNRKGVPYEFRHRHLSYVIVFPMSTVISFEISQHAFSPSWSLEQSAELLWKQSLPSCWTLCQNVPNILKGFCQEYLIQLLSVNDNTTSPIWRQKSYTSCRPRIDKILECVMSLVVWVGLCSCL